MEHHDHSTNNSCAPQKSRFPLRVCLRKGCDRVGCYEPPRTSHHCGAAYCSHECRDAMRRVRDRERKYLWRRTAIGRLTCEAMAMRRRIELQTKAASLSGHLSEPARPCRLTGDAVEAPARSSPCSFEAAKSSARSSNRGSIRCSRRRGPKISPRTATSASQNHHTSATNHQPCASLRA